MPLFRNLPNLRALRQQLLDIASNRLPDGQVKRIAVTYRLEPTERRVANMAESDRANIVTTEVAKAIEDDPRLMVEDGLFDKLSTHDTDIYLRLVFQLVERRLERRPTRLSILIAGQFGLFYDAAYRAFQAGDWSAAEVELHRALWCVRLSGTLPGGEVHSAALLAAALLNQGRYDEAQAVARDAIEKSKRLAPDDAFYDDALDSVNQLRAQI